MSTVMSSFQICLQTNILKGGDFMEHRNPAKDAAILAEIQRMDWEGGRKNDVPGDDRKDPRAPRVKGRTPVPGIDFAIHPATRVAIKGTNGYPFDELDALNEARMEGRE